MNLTPEKSDAQLPRGSYPAMLTAFRDGGVIDWDGVDRLTDHCIDTGAAGIFACGLSAEVLQMTDDEKVQLAERITKRTAGRVPIVAAAISTESIEAQALLIRRMRATGANVMAIGVCQLAAEDEEDEVWIDRADRLLEQIAPEVRLAMYECPLPYHRLLSEQTINWATDSGRFCFLKDTCCRIETIRRRQEMIGGGPLRLFNANTATLLDSLRVGVDGFCGIGANYMPELYAWLCENFQQEQELAAELHRFLESTVASTEDSSYPASAKNYLRQRGLAVGEFSRKVPTPISEAGAARLAEMLKSEREWLARIGG